MRTKKRVILPTTAHSLFYLFPIHRSARVQKRTAPHLVRTTQSTSASTQCPTDARSRRGFLRVLAPTRRKANSSSLEERMSTQRGNPKRSRPQAHQNTVAFRHNKGSKKTKEVRASNVHSLFSRARFLRVEMELGFLIALCETRWIEWS